MEENNLKDLQEDPIPLTDEELEQYQKDIIDFILLFFR